MGFSAAGGASVRSEREFPFRLTVMDAVIGAGGSVLLGSGILAGYLQQKHYTPPASLLNPGTIAPFDRSATTMYHPTLDKAGNLLLGGFLLASPSVAGFGTFRNGEWKNLFTLAVLYSETVVYSLAVSSWSKALVSRYRPYLYNSGIDQETRLDLASHDDARRSFFSRHTILAFSSAVFFSTVAADLMEPEWYTRAAQITSLGVATGIGISRVASGEHFTSDVLAGAAAGAAIGFLVPRMHRSNSGTTISCWGNGIALSLSY